MTLQVHRGQQHTKAWRSVQCIEGVKAVYDFHDNTIVRNNHKISLKTHVFVFFIFTPIYSNSRLLYRCQLALFKPCNSEARITSRDEHMQSLFSAVRALCYPPVRCCVTILVATVLGAFAKLLKATVSFVMYVCQSVRPPARPPARPSVPVKHLGSHKMNFH